MNKFPFTIRDCPYCLNDDCKPSKEMGRLVTCRQCGLTRLYPRASVEASRDMLNHRYSERKSAESSPEPHRFHAANQREIKFILNSMQKPQSALDVGTADGSFVFSLNQIGIKTIGIDPYLGYVEAAQSRNLPIHHAAFDEDAIRALIPPHSLDLLVVRESIYYMHDLKEFFRLAKHLLSADGHLYIKMHVENSLYYDIHRKCCTSRMGDFVSFTATTRTMAKLLEHEGFQIISRRKLHMDIMSSVWPKAPSIVTRIANKLAFPALSLLGKEDRIMLLAKLTN